MVLSVLWSPPSRRSNQTLRAGDAEVTPNFMLKSCLNMLTVFLSMLLNTTICQTRPLLRFSLTHCRTRRLSIPPVE